jgi:dipeptidyl aminopeptidase/acylaminoacyl peptidase
VLRSLSSPNWSATRIGTSAAETITPSFDQTDRARPVAFDRALVHVVGDRNPGVFYEYDTGGASFKRLLTARRWLDPDRLAPVTPVTITARDGQPLQGYLTRLAAGGAGPLIVMPHGGPFES